MRGLVVILFATIFCFSYGQVDSQNTPTSNFPVEELLVVDSILNEFVDFAVSVLAQDLKEKELKKVPDSLSHLIDSIKVWLELKDGNQLLLTDNYNKKESICFNLLNHKKSKFKNKVFILRVFNEKKVESKLITAVKVSFNVMYQNKVVIKAAYDLDYKRNNLEIKRRNIVLEKKI